MSSARLYLRGSLVVAATALLAACAQRGVTLPPAPATPAFSGGAARQLVLPDRAPPKCKGQKTNTRRSP